MDLTGEVIESAVETSDSVGAIAGALAKAQGAMAGAKKDAVNPHFKSRYADLASIWEAARGPLSANELAVVQMTEPGAEGIGLITMLVHSSGEYFRSRLYAPLGQMSTQAMGSAITYLRRYGMAAMVGVAAEDDDAEQADAAARPPMQRSAPANSQGSQRTEAQAARDMRDLLAAAKSPPELDALWIRIERMPFGDVMRGELRRDYEREMNARFPAKAAG